MHPGIYSRHTPGLKVQGDNGAAQSPTLMASTADWLLSQFIKEAAESQLRSSLHGGRSSQQSLQMEGQSINQSLVMGIEVGKSSATNQNRFTPSLNLCSRTGYSSPCLPRHFPIWFISELPRQCFFSVSEHSVFTPTETSSPIVNTFKKTAELFWL